MMTDCIQPHFLFRDAPVQDFTGEDAKLFGIQAGAGRNLPSSAESVFRHGEATHRGQMTVGRAKSMVQKSLAQTCRNCPSRKQNAGNPNAKQKRRRLSVSSTGEVHRGLRSDNVRPSSTSLTRAYDVLIVGAGFAGLTAARDLSKAGFPLPFWRHATGSVDELPRARWRPEIRNRRDVVHWTQPFVWREMSITAGHRRNVGAAADTFAVLTHPVWSLGRRPTLPHRGQGNREFCDIDGFGGTKAIPRPYNVTAETVVL